YLVERLGLGWDEVHVEAHALEHAVSDLVLDRMDEVLGHPARDPHGDPIPRSDGSIERAVGSSSAARLSEIDPRRSRMCHSHLGSRARNSAVSRSAGDQPRDPYSPG
ncbi:hypothetical protein JS562_55000, partial [Agrobacterium sp. S2]|nr:hypothetical protein [Agrobacterium sp. S2]